VKSLYGDNESTRRHTESSLGNIESDGLGLIEQSVYESENYGEYRLNESDEVVFQGEYSDYTIYTIYSLRL
jgi:hypothetical protein